MCGVDVLKLVMIAALWMRMPKKSWDLLQIYLVMRVTKVGILKRSKNLPPRNP